MAQFVYGMNCPIINYQLKNYKLILHPSIKQMNDPLAITRIFL